MYWALFWRYKINDNYSIGEPESRSLDWQVQKERGAKHAERNQGAS